MSASGIVVDGCSAIYGDTTYLFGSHEDAMGFKQCCESGDGRPGPCAEKWNCISKTQATPEKSRKLGR